MIERLAHIMLEPVFCPFYGVVGLELVSVNYKWLIMNCERSVSNESEELE